MQNNNPLRAAILFEQAARAEVLALASLGQDKPRTLGVTAVSAAALWYKSGKLEEAEQVAHRASVMGGMPGFALDELRRLLQAIWNEQAQKSAGILFVPGQVLISVKGGEVVSGGAPLDTILEKIQIIQSIFYRTAEFIKDLPLRKKGPPSKELQARCRPWLFQSVPGSYQFVVAVQKPAPVTIVTLPSRSPIPMSLNRRASLRNESLATTRNEVPAPALALCRPVASAAPQGH